MDREDGKQEFRICIGYYRIYLDKKGRVDSLVVGNDVPQYRRRNINDIDMDTFRKVLRHLLVEEPAEFSKLYLSVKKNDPDMFVYVDAVVNSVGNHCKALSAEE